MNLLNKPRYQIYREDDPEYDFVGNHYFDLVV